VTELLGPKGTRDNDLVNFLKGAESGLAAFAWPLQASGPGDSVAQALDSAGFFVMRAAKAAKEGNKAELLATCHAFNAAFKAVGEWIKENAKMGLTWNAKGAALKD
jgi:hypothetical protein